MNKPFQRFFRNEGIAETAICEAVARAERGLVDADLGGGVTKQRIPRPNEGRSGGFRTVILYKAQQRAFFVYGFSKNHIVTRELGALKDLAAKMLNCDEGLLQEAVQKRFGRR